MSTPETEFISILGSNAGAGQDATGTKVWSKSLPESLPILGLSDIVIFPGTVTPLLVETPQSIRLIDDVVAGDRFLGLVLQRNSETENPTPADLWLHGCAGRVSRMLKFPDGTVRILVEGLRRFRVVNYTAETPYLVAKIEKLKDITDDSLELAALTRNAEREFQEIVKTFPDSGRAGQNRGPQQRGPRQAGRFDRRQFESQPGRAPAPAGNAGRQGLFDAPAALAEPGVGSPQAGFQNSKRGRHLDVQKPARLFPARTDSRHPARIGRGRCRGGRSQGSARPDRTEQPARGAQESGPQGIGASPADAPRGGGVHHARNYLDWLINLPWSKFTSDKLDLAAAARLLDEQHFGLTKVKDRLLEFLAVIKLKQQLKGPILCLVGPPGVGKTSLGRSVAESLGRKFARISLGGMRDEAEIRGHRRTYVGALPGRIIQTLRRAESSNPVILLDELDKVGSDFRGDPASALLEVLDPAQNNSFIDHYLDVPYDLSRVLFLTTANWLEPVHPALRDRLEVIELPSYTGSEKVQIAKRHLVPRQLEEHGLKKKLVRFPDATLRHLVHDYTREAGVRQLERQIAALTRKAARKIVARKALSKALTIAPSMLVDYLGPPPFNSETAERITEFGIAIGLGWTPVGGEILFVEATRMPGKGQLILTGSLGEVMKESAQTGLSLLRNKAAELKIDLSDFDKRDIHIHVPAGATPKDGPSAGVTIVAALASLLMHRTVRSDTAMTGEISLRGRVLRVGGIKEKALAAARSGLKHMILPDQNRNDWLEVPAEVRHKLKAHFIKNITQLFPLALSAK